MSDHCCDVMAFYTTEENSLIDYNRYTRSGYFFVNSPNGTHQRMNYCFWCGTKVPEDLGDEWAKILKEDYNLDNPFEDWDRVPAEFKTDEWWKKRGL